MNRSPALETLLAGLVDYAGLFPPAALPMPAAVTAYATYTTGTDRALLGRFVVPAARLEEFGTAARALAPAMAPTAATPWHASALATPTDAEPLAAFNAHAGGRILIDTVEAKAESVEALAAIAHALGQRYTTFVEIPVRDDPSALVAALAKHRLRAKIRTGGVTADAFPPPAAVLRFLVACTTAGVPFKATAGLHHPLRGEYALTYAHDAPRGTMHGFLNIFLTAALLRAGVPAAEVAPLLEERDPAAITVAGDTISWRSHSLTGSGLAAVRAEFAGSFGSCSFEEPVQDLTSLRLR